MTSAFDSAGYTDIRAYIQANWLFVALVDDAGNEVTRIEIGNDSVRSGTGRELTWTSGSGANPLEAQVTVKGSDSDLPDLSTSGSSVTFARSESYKTSSATTRMAGDPFTNATLEAPADELTLTHIIRQPP